MSAARPATVEEPVDVRELVTAGEPVGVKGPVAAGEPTGVQGSVTAGEPVGRVTVRYGGERTGSGPVTVGQANMIRCVLSDPPEHMNYRVVLDLQPGTTLTDIAAAAGTLLSRHESLRTTFRDGIQYVAAEGELSVEVHEGGGSADVADEVASWLQAVRFDLAAEISVRMAVIVSDGVPERLVFVTTHSTVDAGGLAVLRSELNDLLLGKPLAAVTAPQPLDVAESERTPASVRRAEAALRYWETQLWRIPRSTLTVAVDGDDNDWLLPRLRVRSTAAARALGRIAARTGASRSAAVLAAFAALAGVRAGQPEVVALAISANRFRPELREYVGPLAQDALVPVGVDEPTFDGVLRRTRAASLAAYQNSRFDSDALIQIMERVHRERGVFFARDIVFNDMSIPGLGRRTGGRTAEEGPDIRSHWLPDATLPTRTSLWVHLLEGEVDFTLWADPRCLPRADAQAVGEGIMRLLVEAGDRDVPMAELSGLTGVLPVPRDDGWLMTDSCWVELAEVRRLVADAVDGRPFLVTPVDGRLVCHLAAPATPQEVHTACVARLFGRMSAMAPHHYVICESAPGSPDGWQDQPVIAEGSGR
ncbi:condensation domain-containing protein [Streptosporangium sp. NPDC051022]|uniref:condensation domain-containing protein n=1 Tax=Streptosporangium sp. NPDC051022 TaxID=3155752 RepID=UPI0034218D2F